MDATSTILRCEDISKSFPGVHALRGISLAVERGSCHALVGENGAGKSTLGKILAGLYSPERGHIMLEDKPVRFSSPADAMKAGVAMVHQELLFCENLSVAENLCMGELPRWGRIFVRQDEMIRRARTWLAQIGAQIDPRRIIGELPVSQQQLVQIAAAVGRGARILVFDEPTSSLSQPESERLFSRIQDLRAQGVTILYISHRLEEIFRLCDTISVLRDGERIATRPAAAYDRDALVRDMIGRSVSEYFPGHIETTRGKEILRVEELSSPAKFSGVSFTVHAGEVLGLAGLVGAGRTEVAEALFGLDPMARGRVYVRGDRLALGSPEHAMALGLGLAPEDRKRHGLVLSMNARENISLPILKRLSRFGWVCSKDERGLAEKYFARLKVRAPGIEAGAEGLSGGNQQKLVIARWMAARCGVLLVDEPTRGVDVGAKAEIHGLIDEMVREGAGVLLISSELPELINLATRVIVMRAGRIAGEVSRKESTQENLMRLMAGLA